MDRLMAGKRGLIMSRAGERQVAGLGHRQKAGRARGQPRIFLSGRGTGQAGDPAGGSAGQ